MSQFLGWGQDGWGVIYGGYTSGDPNAPVPVEEGATVLFDPDSPNFLVKVKLRVAGAKPAPTDVMTGPLVEFISHFWLILETTGITIADITGNNPGTLAATHGTITFGAAEYGGGVIATNLSGTDDLTIPSVVLEGKYSVESLSNTAGAGWVHKVITNDPTNGFITYINGVQTSAIPYQTSPLTIDGLFTLGGAVVPNQILEYARIWSMALDAPEVAALYVDPYTMFGVNADVLNEIRTIVNFMKPIRSQWRFVYL